MFNKSKKGNVGLYMSIIFLALIIIVVAGILVPFGVKVSTEVYSIGEDLMLDANETISQINNTVVRNRIQSSINGGLDNIETNIEVNSSIFQYSWLVVLLLACIVAFLTIRQNVEYGRMGGFV